MSDDPNDKRGSTPRTDAAENECNCTVNGAVVRGVVTADFARQLERELVDKRGKDLPPLEEMGDINGALKNILLVQAQYARQSPGITRQMRDVACESLEHEIQRYVAARLSTARLAEAEAILRQVVEAASADKLEDFSRTSNVADMAAGFLRACSDRGESR